MTLDLEKTASTIEALVTAAEERALTTAEQAKLERVRRDLLEAYGDQLPALLQRASTLQGRDAIHLDRISAGLRALAAELEGSG